MKTRKDIYKGEAEELLRVINTYHVLRYQQILQLFSSNNSINALVANLIKQGRIFYDKEKDLLSDMADAEADPGLIAAFWVLLDFQKAVVYHINGSYPIKIHFFSQDEEYEIIYIAPGQETLISHILETIQTDANRLIILETEGLATQLSISNVAAFCVIDTFGTVSYYQKK